MPSMRYLAELYLPNRQTDLQVLAARAHGAAEQASRAGPPVQFITAIHAVEDENCFMIYEAATAAAVVAAGSLAGILFDRVVSVTTAGLDPAWPG